MKKKGIKSNFKIFLLTYALLLVALIIFGLVYVWNLLIGYEAAMPDVNMEKHMSEFSVEQIGTTLEKFPLSINEYNSQADVKKYYEEFLSGKEITYRKYTGKYTNKTPIYEILADGEAFASAELQEVGKAKYDFSIWEMTNVDFASYTGVLVSCKIKAPADAQIMVNGKEIDEKYFVENQKITMTENLDTFIEDIPMYKVYVIPDLIVMPEVTTSGAPYISVNEEGVDFAFVYATDDVLKLQVQDRIMDMAHSYGRYIINRGSLGTMQSYMVGKAREYVSDIPAVWAYLYGQDYSYTFSNEEISNFVRYNDNCFGCDVKFTLNVVYGGNSISYDTHFKCMYVFYNGAWYLADFVLSNE